MSREKKFEYLAKTMLVVVHVAGIIGMLSPWRDFFLALTPVNLLFSFAILLSFHTGRSVKFYLIMTFIMIAGFIIEIIGVNTGFPFGTYTYGEVLGPQFLGTPFMIGVNWFIMAYCGAMLFKNFTNYPLVNAILAGTLITLVDLLLEPVAITFNFWNWADPAVPIQNYLTWGTCISLFSLLIYNLQIKKKNPISNWVLGVQILFFAGLLIGTSL